MTPSITPFSLKDAPALIERLLPVQKLSVESYKEQEARQSKTLTALGSYWKGRKPLILNKACILGCLLPATDDPAHDLEIFEKLMAMDDESFVVRWKRRPRPKEILATLSIARIADYFTVETEDVLPDSVPVDWSKPEYARVKVAWRADCSALERRRLEVQMLPKAPYRERVDQAQRPEEAMDTVHDHIWDAVNDHLGTSAHAFPELVEQLGIMRFGHRPRVADTFCGSGQIPFEAARLGCDVYASDLNPVACLLTWGAFNIVGGSEESREKLAKEQWELVRRVQEDLDNLGVETDGKGWRAKVFLHCVETRCPQTGWMVPLLPTRLVSKGYRVVTELVPDPLTKRYAIQIRTGVSKAEIEAAETGTVGREGKYGEAYLIHQVDSVAYKTKISTLRGDYQKPDGTIGNRLRLWEKLDFIPLAACLTFSLTQVLNLNSRLSRFDNSEGGAAATKGAFDNQALNTLFNYGTRGIAFLRPALEQKYPSFPVGTNHTIEVHNHAADKLTKKNDLFITDPPYGDAIKYEEILDFFIAWLRKNPPPEFADWVWDSRRSLAIKGEDEDFRRSMVAAYRRMTECMPDNGIQVIMFTHQNGSIWGDMANIVWASGLQVTAAWYVATETDSALRAGSHVKGTVLLVCRKRQGLLKTTRDDLAWEIQEEVEAQVRALTGLNQEARGLYRDENVFEDADLQMAGYAAALRVLTRYAIIDGRDMTAEAIRPRVRGETTFVDSLIAFAVDTANQCLVPPGIAKVHWDGLTGAERFYLKLVDLEARGLKTLDNYQNFAKAFKVRDFRALMASQKANQARLKSAVEFGKTEMSDSSELHQSVLRAVLYAMMELVKNVDSNEVLAHLTLNVPDYYANQTQRDRVVELSDYLARKLETQRPDEASAARILRELVRHQRLG